MHSKLPSSRLPHWMLAGLAAVIAGAVPRLHAQAWLLDSAVAPTIVNDASAQQTLSFVGLAGGDYLAYGSFSHVNGIAVGRVARFHANGTLDSTFSPDFADNESLVGIAPLRDGRFAALVGTTSSIAPFPIATAGDETSPGDSVTVSVGVSSVYRVALMRLRVDGKKDPTFSALGIDGGLATLKAAPDGSVFVWGNFRTLGSSGRNGLARLTADGAIDPQFNPSLTSAQLNIAAIATAADGSVFISAVAFGSNTRTTSYLLVKVKPTGDVDPQFKAQNITRTYDQLVAQPDGSVIASNGKLLRFTATGGLDNNFNAGIPQLQNVSRLAPLPNGRVAVEAYVGPVVPSATALVIIRADGTLERDLRKVSGGDEGDKFMAALPDGRIILQQGPLVFTSSPYYPLPMVTTTTTADVSATPVSADAAAAAATSTLMPIFAGPTIYNPTLAITSADASSIAPLPLSFTQRQNGSVSRIEVDATGRALVAGQFTHVNGEPRPGLARFLANGSLDSTFVPPMVQLLFAPSDGRPIVSRTTVGAAASDGYHRLLTNIVRLQTTGQIDSGFTFPSGFDIAQTKFLATATDGRLLIATFAPDNSREENLKLIWLAPDGRESSRLSTVFTGFYRSIIMPLATIGTTTVATGTAPATTTTATIVSGSGTVVSAPIVPPTVVAPSEPTTAVAPIVPYPYYRANPIDAARIVAGGRLLVSGAFLRVNGVARSDLARLNADGSLDTTYAFVGTPPPYFGLPVTFATNEGANGEPTTGDTTTVTTGVTSAVPVTATVTTVQQAVSAAAAAAAVAATTIAVGPPTYTTVLPLNDGRAIVFTATYGPQGSITKLVRLAADGTVDPTFKPAASFSTTNLQELSDGSYYNSGRRYFVDGSLDRNFAPRLGFAGYTGYGGVVAMDQNRRIWVGGYFDTVNGQPRKGLARFVSAEVNGITFQPTNLTVVAGRTATFEVVIGTTQPATYRWTHDGVTIAGATTDTLTLHAVTAADAGVYRAIVTLGGQTLTSDPATLTVRPNNSRLVNFSARSRIDPSTPPQIAGAVLNAITPRPVLLRAVGRGVPGNTGGTMLPVPVLSLYDGSRMIAQDRGSAVAPQITTMAHDVGAFPVVGVVNSSGAVFGSALATTLGSGAFTAATTSGDGGSGISLFELYDTASTSEPPLIRNLAIRGQTGADANVLTAGFVISGNGPLQLLIRGVGPALRTFGVPGTVTDPAVQVFSPGNGTPVATNDNWDNEPALVAATAASGAFPLATGSKDAALLLTLEPGAYTVQLVGANGEAGAGMIEIYVVD